MLDADEACFTAVVTCSTPKREVILMGDFNDFDGEVLDANDNQPTSNVITTFKQVQ